MDARNKTISRKSLVEDRVQREKTFHNKIYSEGTRKPADKYYTIVKSSRNHHLNILTADCRGKRVLEYGCGCCVTGIPYMLARKGAEVHAIDISEEAITRAKEKALALGLSGAITFRVMDAERMEYEGAFFDLITGTSILHHLNQPRALLELARVLKASGKAVFLEPSAANPMINLYRRLTPHLRSADEQPLRRQDIALMADYFDTVKVHHFHLLALLAVPFRQTPLFGPVFAVLNTIDGLLMKLPVTKSLAWMLVIEMSEPKQRPAAG